MRPRLRVLPLALALVAALALTACPGGKEAAQGGAGAGKASGSAAPRLTLARAPKAQMHVGTESVVGRAVAYCRQEVCAPSTSANPARYVPMKEAGFVLFVVPQIPAKARVRVAGVKGGEASEQDLNPSTTMAWAVTLPAGRYEVRLDVEWKTAKGSWIFGLEAE